MKRGLVPTFQLSPAAQPADLDSVLSGRGYESRSPTLVQVVEVDAALHALPKLEIPVSVGTEPDERWMHLWWSVDGRGGLEARTLARDILIASPSLYASAYAGAEVAAVGRLALIDGWGGVYCMAVRQDLRRRGYAKSVLRSLLREAADCRIRHAWLQVTDQNRVARALYAAAGFVTASKYHYRVGAGHGAEGQRV